MEHVKIENWDFCGYWNYVPELKNSAELGEQMTGVTDFMPAQVPGSVYTDLLRNGLIPDPNYEMNSLACEWVANRWWVYRGKFVLEKDPAGEKVELCVNGVDYAARFYVNDLYLARHEGAFIPFVYDITGCVRKGENTLCVVLEHAPFVHGQIGYTSEVDRYKSRYNCKWDFSTRLVGVGIYDEIYVRLVDKGHIAETHTRSSFRDGNWYAQNKVGFRVRVGGSYRIVFRLLDGADIVFSQEQTGVFEVGDHFVAFSTSVENPRLWYPLGYGEAALYTAETLLYYENDCQDTVRSNFAFRHLRYERTEGASEDALPYVPVVNGLPVYIKGVNVVPFELYLNMDDADICQRQLRDVAEANMNLVRVWGGGMIASEHFYNICDRLGIMVWQEFLMSSSGCDNIPSKREPFVSQLMASAEHVVRQKRNHPSLIFWSGGNELSDERYRDDPVKKWTPATFRDSTLSKLKEVVERLDPDRLMLPTSASGPLENLDPAKPGQNHDVHGPWKYMGEGDHYTLYNTSDSMLHSEFGCDGMSELDSLRRFLGPQNLKFTTADENLVWRHHGEWWDTYRKRERVIFGEFTPDELVCYIKCSQYMQAEGLRYAVEANRRRRPKNCGSIIWQLNEPWPNVYCTNLVDYYGKRKLAYYFVAEAFAETTPILSYDSFTYSPGEVFRATVSVLSDFFPFDGEVVGTVCHAGGEYKCLHRGLRAEKYTTEIGEISFKVPENTDSFEVRIALSTAGKSVEKSYLFLIRDPKTRVCSREVVCRYYDSYKKHTAERGRQFENI